MEKTSLKKAVIISIIILVPLTIVGFILWNSRDKATCYDDRQNQGESGVDCGGPCSPCFSITQDLSVKRTEIVYGGDGIYDGIAQISNPNGNAGSPSFAYIATLKDVSGNVIEERTGTSFIMPADSKYIALLNFSVSESQIPGELDFKITDTSWRPLSTQKPPLNISNKDFGPSQDGIGERAYGIVKNESSYDLDTITITVVLRDSDNKAVAVNLSNLNTVLSGEERDFPLNWPYKLQSEPVSMEVEAETNMYDSSNLLKIRI